MRETIIDTDTRAGYNFLKQQYFVENKETATYRDEAQNIKNVLDIVAPDNTVTTDDFLSMSTTYEALKSLSYTWSDNGAYIKTVQFNDYKDYPLTLDCEKAKLYIMNTELIFDLTLNESRLDRLQRIQSYYKTHIGLLMNIQDLEVIYNTLTNFYHPTCYNEILTHENISDTTSYTYTYSNYVYLSNYDNNSKAVYNVLTNPSDQYTYGTIADIIGISNNTITLTDTVPSQLHEGQRINVGSVSYSDGLQTLTADGTYTISAIGTNYIATTENLPIPYEYKPPVLCITAYKTFIREIDRDRQAITLTNFATDFLIGDKIIVRGTKIVTEYETLSVDGEYTIIGIEDDTIFVNEVPNTNYSSSLDVAYVYKPIEVLTVHSIDNNTITVEEDSFPATLQINTPVVVMTTVEDDTYAQYGTVVALDEAHHAVTVIGSILDYEPAYGKLRELIPYPQCLVTVENTTDSSVMPTGEFMLDNTTQVIDYISLMNGLEKPTEDMLKRGGEEVPHSMTIVLHDTEMIAEMLGTYSKVYSEK